MQLVLFFAKGIPLNTLEGKGGQFRYSLLEGGEGEERDPFLRLRLLAIAIEASLDSAIVSAVATIVVIEQAIYATRGAAYDIETRTVRTAGTAMIVVCS